MEEEGGEFRGPWGRGPKPTLSLVSPHIRVVFHHLRTIKKILLYCDSVMGNNKKRWKIRSMHTYFAKPGEKIKVACPLICF